jgi:PHD/YefM family antitoxin component YafN of YafNO toxin-antitoxin module
MDLDEIRQIIEADGGKFIIVENGKPVMVILSFEEYKQKLKKENPVLKKELPKKIPPKELTEGEIKVEDLPL